MIKDREFDRAIEEALNGLTEQKTDKESTAWANEVDSELSSLTAIRPRLCCRKGVYFVSIRMWKETGKSDGLRLISKAKDNVDMQIASDMASDFVKGIKSIFGAASGCIISAPSARHSAFIGVDHFASVIAKMVAKELGSPYVQLFKPTKATAKGHWPTREKDAPVIIPNSVSSGARVILVDDLATSGQTLEVHVKALAKIGVQASAITWVYGQTTGDGKKTVTGLDDL